MNVKMDLHTHTVASGHHTSDTVTSLAENAFKRGLDYLGITDHAPKMQGSASESYFRNLKFCDRVLYGVNMLYGVELNILNVKGEVDLKPEILEGLDYSIASLHRQTFKPLSEEENTRAILNAMKNPYIIGIGHPDDPTYRLNIKKTVEGAKETGTLLEVSSVGISPEGYRNYGISRLVEMLLECKRLGVYVMLGSDSHGKEKVGDFKNSEKLFSLVGFPQELVVNCDPELFFRLVKNKRLK